MSSNNNQYRVPSYWKRLSSVWYRHVRVYNSSFFSNAFPPFFEPLIFLAGLGVGIGASIQNIGGMNYVLFLASGLIVTSAMFTAAFECTYGTFVRLEFDKVYDGMLGAPISVNDLILGEVLFAGTKGFLFSFAVLIVIWATGIIQYPLSLVTPFVGFLTGLMFASLSMFITSLVKNMNHFNFYISGVLSPMFFFSGVVFPLENLPSSLRLAAEVIPLTHVVRLARAFCIPNGLYAGLLFDLLYGIVFFILLTVLAVHGLRKRMIQ